MRRVRAWCSPCAARGVLVDGQEYQISGPDTTVTVAVCPRCQVRSLDPLIAAASAFPNAPTGRMPFIVRSTRASSSHQNGRAWVECSACVPPARMTTRHRSSHVDACHRGKKPWQVTWRALPGSGLDACPHPDCHGYPVSGVRGVIQHARHAHPGDNGVITEFFRRRDTHMHPEPASTPTPRTSTPTTSARPACPAPVVIGPPQPLSLPNPAITG